MPEDLQEAERRHATGGVAKEDSTGQDRGRDTR
jgi:hypothetical protein